MMPEPPRSLEAAELAGDIRDLADSLRSVERAIARIRAEFSALKRILQGASQNGPVSRAGEVVGWSPSQAAEMALQAQARIGVGHVEITHVPGGAKVSIPGHPTIYVSTAEGDLLDELVKDDGSSDDGKVAWKTLTELCRRLEKRGKSVVTPRAIIQRIYRLRQVMRREGLNSLFVESDDELGYRFALRSTRPGDGADAKDVTKTRLA